MSHRPSLQSIHVDSSYFDNSIDVTAPSSSSSASNRNGTNGTQMKSLLNRDRDSKQKETVMRNMYANMTTLPAAATSFFRGNNGPGLPIGLKAKQSNYVVSDIDTSPRSFSVNQLLSKKNSVLITAVSFICIIFLLLQFNYQGIASDGVGSFFSGKGSGTSPSPTSLSDPSTISAEVLMGHCHHVIGDPRVIKVNENVWVATGFDLANTILIRTSEGDIIVDVAMSPIRARKVKEALYDAIPGGRNPMGTHSIIYTHSHIDHTGGGKAWIEDADPSPSYLPEGSSKFNSFLNEVQNLQNHTLTYAPGYGKYQQIHVYSTDEVIDHFFKQVGAFRVAEKVRGARQYGQSTAITELPCIGIGARPDVDEVQREFGFQMPTRTFRKYMSYQAGEEIVELYEAHGETHDMLFVWLPRTRTLLPGDNYYHAFPNLYTIRGTSPRPVNSWITSLDVMRKMKPQYLVPSHTEPIIGEEAIANQLTVYRDAIQWVYIETIKGANAGISIDDLVGQIKLPPHLASNGALIETYGQVDWSVRAIYDANLGWFDGEPEDLYPLAPNSLSLHVIDAMGGKDQIFDELKHTLQKGEGKWALYLIKMLQNLPSDELTAMEKKSVEKMKVEALGDVANDVYNSNGKGYLLQSAHEILNGGVAKEKKPKLDDTFVDNIPLHIIWEVLRTRLTISDSIFEVNECVLFILDDEKWYLTQRRGLFEITQGEPLLGTPEPVGTLIMSEVTWKRISLQKLSPMNALLSGEIKLEGSQLKILNWLRRIETGA